MALLEKVKDWFTGEHEIHPEIAHAEEDLEALDKTAARDEIIRRRMKARLAALSAELDNLTRRGGIL